MKLRLIAVFLLMLLIFTGCNKIGEAPIEIQSSETESNATECDSNKKDDSSVNFTDTTDTRTLIYDKQPPAKRRFGGGCYYMLFENDIVVSRLTLSQPPYRLLIS